LRAPSFASHRIVQVARMNNAALDAELVRLDFFSAALNAFFK
jgi:hypothetical protein